MFVSSSYFQLIFKFFINFIKFINSWMIILIIFNNNDLILVFMDIVLGYIGK